MMSSGYLKNAKMLSSFAYSVFKYLSEQVFIAQYARQQNLVAIGLNYKDKNKTATQLENFYNELSKTAKQLVNNPNLFISKPNKGSGVVLL